MFRFLYRGKIYHLDSGETKYVVLSPEERIFVVASWEYGIPAILDDIRFFPKNISIEDMLSQGKDLVTLATQVEPLPGEFAEPYAVLDFEGKRYAFPMYWQKGVNDTFVQIEDRIFCLDLWKDGTHREVAKFHPITPSDEKMLEGWLPTRAREVPDNLPGLQNDPRDVRIHFTYESRKYLLSSEAYHEGKGIYIPNKGFFAVGGWLESMPVQPAGLHQIKEERQGILTDYVVAVPYEESPDISRYSYSDGKE